MRRLALLAAVAALAGCGGTAGTSPPVTTTTATVVAQAPEPPSCTALFERLRRITVALKASSALIANSLNKQQLERRIETERVQLDRAADLMAAGAVPTSLQPANARLVAALRAVAADFARARVPAARGDFRRASALMGDSATVQRILAASSELERACRR